MNLQIVALIFNKFMLNYVKYILTFYKLLINNIN